MADNAARSGASPRRAGRGGVPALPLQRSPRRPLLAGRRCQEHARPLDVRPTEGRRIRQGRRRQMDRRRDRRTWRSARRHSRELRLGRLQGRRRRGADLPQLATPRARARPRPLAQTQRTGRIAGGRAATVRHVAADYGHSRRIVSPQTRHHGSARSRLAPLPPTLLLPARRAQPDRDLAGDDRRRHRSFRQSDRRASHLARSQRLQRGDARQGADRHAETGDGRPARTRRPLRRGGRGDGGGRRHRDHAVAAMRLARHADGGSALGRTPRRHPVPADIAPALRCPRRRSGRGCRDGDLDRPGAGGRDRGDRALAAPERLQRGPAAARPRRASGRDRGCRSRRRTSRASWNWRHRPEGKAPCAVPSSLGIGCGSSASERTAPTAF